MPAGFGAMPPMGGANPANLEQLAAAGDPRAIAMLQQLQAQQAQAGGGGPPQGAPMPGPGGMSQSQFGNGGGTVSPDVQAARAQQLIQLLRNRR